MPSWPCLALGSSSRAPTRPRQPAPRRRPSSHTSWKPVGDTTSAPTAARWRAPVWRPFSCKNVVVDSKGSR
eukprot:6348421-Pyramimonas_sp.AAC.1